MDKVAAGEGNFGHDAAAGEYGDPVATGVLDSTEVVRSALQNASSVAGARPTTEAAVAGAAEPSEAGA